MAVIFKYVIREVGGAFVTSSVVSCISPFAGDGLYEPLRLSVCLGSVGAGKLVFDAKVEAGCGKGPRAVADTVVGKHPLDSDAMEGVEADGLFQSSHDTGDFLVRQDTGVGKAGVVVDGHVQSFDAGALATIGTVAGAADARPFEAAELLDVQVDQFARTLPFVANNRGRRRLE